MTAPGHLRIGLWLDGPLVSRYASAFVAWARSQPAIDVIGLQTAPSPVLARPKGPLSAALYRLLLTIESAQLDRQPRHRDHLKTSELSELGCATETHAPEASNAAALQAMDLDLVVSLATELPPGSVTSSARLGTVAFEWADAARRKGMPVGFWEVLERQDTTGFAITHIDARSGSPSVLLRGHVPTRHYFLLNQAALYEKAHYHLRAMLSGLASAGHFPPARPSTATDRTPLGYPSAWQTAAYLRRSLASMVRKRLARLAGREEHWHVSFLRADWRDADLSQGRDIDNPPGRYLADPFVIRRDGRDFCFVEDFDCARSRGGIGVYELGQERAERLGVAIDEPFHLSFPYLFEHDGALFMCPETSENRDIRIYRCVDFPLKWQLEKIAMSGLSAVDTMLFERAGKWWMFTNIDPAETGEICSELYIFSAASPFADTWQPHARNPVLFDAACARNGGLLVDGGELFRVSQRQGFDRYGKGSQINQVLTLSDEAYEERCVARIDPVFRKGLLGTHHLHSRDGITVFDFLAETTARASASA